MRLILSASQTSAAILLATSAFWAHIGWVTARLVAPFGDENAGCAPAHFKRWGGIMPITRYLADIDLTPNQREVIEHAFDATLKRLDLVDRNDPVCEIVARKVMDVASSGLTDHLAISDIAAQQLVPR